MNGHTPGLRRYGLLLVSLLATAGCGAVHVRDVRPEASVNGRRGDVLTGAGLSAATREALLVYGLDPAACAREPRPCADGLAAAAAAADETRLAALAELELARALTADARPGFSRGTPRAERVEALESYASAARSSYAYLFFTPRAPGERAFEDRQTQVRDFYNFATERFAQLLFEHRGEITGDAIPVGAWSVRLGDAALRLPGGRTTPAELVPASRLRLDGIRSVYRRDGFGAPFVAVGAEPPPRRSRPAPRPPLVEPRFLAATVVLRFPGDTLAAVLATRTAILAAHDPYADDPIVVGARRVPLAANFTAPYALWLSESRFERDARLSLIRRGAGLDAPRVYLMQPYDPNRRTVVLLHGLGSSPAAWVNLVNEIMGDAELRERYQVWQVFYPTSLPIPANRRAIDEALRSTMAALDPARTARATERVTLVGHSMGGVIARLLLVESGDALWNGLFDEPVTPERRERFPLLEPYLDLHPLPEADEAIFLAAPHRGAPLASRWLGRTAARALRLPQSVAQTIGSVADAIAGDTPLRAAQLRKRRNSITNLSDRDDYLRATAALAIAPGVAYHSIVGRREARGPLAESSDGVVPYASSHLDGAASELVVASRHAVQETPQAILEIRRILHEKPEPAP
jgi:pimeloyl-ACP methyl ester carboxylesterase